MFVQMNLIPSGYMLSRADLLGFTDEQIEIARAQNASPERRAEVNGALQEAANALYHRAPEGRPC